MVRGKSYFSALAALMAKGWDGALKDAVDVKPQRDDAARFYRETRKRKGHAAARAVFIWLHDAERKVRAEQLSHDFPRHRLLPSTAMLEGIRGKEAASVIYDEFEDLKRQSRKP